jgi:KipI family sensor histidine kinase inhibitor
MSGSDQSERANGSSGDTFRLLPLGDSAVTVEFGDEIDPAVNARVVAYANTVANQGWTGVLDIVPTYRSVTVHFDPLQWDWNELTDRLRTLPRPDPTETASRSVLHTIPVLYGGRWGPDLEDVAAYANLPLDQTITLHASIRYRVYMLGFSPGFPYLGTVPERLAMPRLPTPRTKVPAGSVGIAERQTGIYPTVTPGGWRLIGRTPIPLFRKIARNPFPLRPGDQVQFRPIEQDEFDRLSCESGREDY